MTPAQLRALVPLRAPRTITLACWPWVPVLCAAVEGYLEALNAVYSPAPAGFAQIRKQEA